MNKIVKIGLAVIGVIAAFMWYQLPGRDVPAAEAVESSSISIMFLITYILLGIAVATSLLFTFNNLFRNPKSLKKSLMVIGALVVVVVLAYVLSSGTDVDLDEMAARGVATTETTVKRIGTGLNVFFILVVVAVGTMAWGGIKKMSN